MPSENTQEFPKDHTRQLPRTRAVRLTRQVVFATLGGTCLLVGMMGLVLPIIPGIPLTILGLTILSLEFRWAKRAQHKMKMKARKLTKSRNHKPRH